MPRLLALGVLGLLLAAIPLVVPSALRSTSPAAPTDDTGPLTYRAELRSFSRNVGNGEARPGGESRSTIWRRGTEFRAEITQWPEPGIAWNLKGKPIVTGTTIRGANEFWVASYITNVPDVDILGQPLSAQHVTVTPVNAFPMVPGSLGIGGVVRDPDDAKGLLGALGSCYDTPQLVGRRTVAQQAVNVFEFPRHTGCVSTPIPDITGTAARQLFVDIHTGLILKDEALDASGAVIPYSETEITKIDYDVDLPDSLFEFEPAHGAIVRRCPDLQCGSMSFPEEQSIDRLPDYTVVTLHTAIEDDRMNYFAQVIFSGSKRDIPLSRDCYEDVRRVRLAALPNTLSTLVPRECRPS